MNMYFLIAIALGAFTGVVEAPVSRPALAGVIANREERARQRAVRKIILPRAAATFSFRSSSAIECESRRYTGSLPLTGAASPRAPAHA